MKKNRLKGIFNILVLFTACLIIKFVMNSMFIYLANENKNWLWISDKSVFAEDKKVNLTVDKKNNLENIQKKISLLQNQLNELNNDISMLNESVLKGNGFDSEGLEQKRVKLENEKKEIDAEKESLNALKEEIEKKVVELTRIQETVKSELEKKKIIQENRIKHLIKVYTTMPPKKAAALIEQLEMEVVMELFSQMKGENVGEILPYVSPEKAAKISEKLAKINL